MLEDRLCRLIQSQVQLNQRCSKACWTFNRFPQFFLRSFFKNFLHLRLITFFIDLWNLSFVYRIFCAIFSSSWSSKGNTPASNEYAITPIDQMSHFSVQDSQITSGAIQNMDPVKLVICSPAVQQSEQPKSIILMQIWPFLSAVKSTFSSFKSL